MTSPLAPLLRGEGNKFHLHGEYNYNYGELAKYSGR